MPKPFLSVVVPAYNEAGRLPLTLIDIDKYLSRAEYSSEVIVVNGDSIDATRAVVERFERLMPNLRLLNCAESRGKGRSVREGMRHARGNYRLFMDADNATSIDHFAEALPLFREGYDVVIGSRIIKGAKLDPPQPLWRRFLGRAGNLVVQALAVPGVWDTQCGFKVFSEAAAERIFQASVIERWGFDVELLAIARLYGLKIKEMPVHWVNDARSTVGGGAYFSTLADVFRIRRRIARGEYSSNPASK